MRAVVVAALLLFAAGCASEQEKADEKRAKEFAKEAKGAQAAADAISREMVAEADRMEGLRSKRDDLRLTSCALRLQVGHAVLQAIEDAELSYDIGERYYRLRGRLGVPPEYLARLDADVKKSSDIARRIIADRAGGYVATKTISEPDARRILGDLELDRTTLKAYRTDMNVVGLETGLAAGQR